MWKTGASKIDLSWRIPEDNVDFWRQTQEDQASVIYEIDGTLKKEASYIARKAKVAYTNYIMSILKLHLRVKK